MTNISELGNISTPPDTGANPPKAAQNGEAAGDFSQVFSETLDATTPSSVVPGEDELIAGLRAMAEMTSIPAMTNMPSTMNMPAMTNMPGAMGTSGINSMPEMMNMTNMMNMPGMMGMSGMSGTNGMNPMLQGLMAPGLYEMQNGMLAAANEGEMSGEHLLVFMMMMMMQSAGSGGSMSDFGPIMQVMAAMLSSLDSQNNASTENLGMMPRFGGVDADARRMVEVALSRVGYQERNSGGSVGDGNFTKFGAWYGLDGQPWCAMFVSWAADQAGILGSIVPRHAWTPSGVEAYRERGLFEERGSGYLPREGDAIYFFNPAKGRVAHVGIVVAFNPATQRVYTVEGNTNNMVAIRHYDLSDPRIHGFGRNGGTSFGTPPQHSTSGNGLSTV